MSSRHKPLARTTPQRFSATVAALVLTMLSANADSAPPSGVPSTGVRIACPQSIETVQKLANPQLGWQEQQLGATSRAIYAEIYRGSPSEEDIVMPTATSTASGVETTEWVLPRAARQDGLWLLCAYQNTRVTISKRLPVGAAHCVQKMSADRGLAIRFLEAFCR
jgi:hypothetical protein